MPRTGEAIWIYLQLDDNSYDLIGSVTATGTTIAETLNLSGRNLLANAHGILLTLGQPYAEERGGKGRQQGDEPPCSSMCHTTWQPVIRLLLGEP